ncbi:MAG: hypothetical protein AAF497_14195, partial [Planctomycetota bacterium]
MSAKKQSARRRKLKKLADKKRKRRKSDSRNTNGYGIAKVTPRQAEKLKVAYHMMEEGDFDNAKLMLDRLAHSQPRSIAVAQMQLDLYQRMENTERCCVVARRLMRLTPKDYMPFAVYAQSSMFCGRASIALIHLRQIQERFPSNPVSKLQEQIQICEVECEKR